MHAVRTQCEVLDVGKYWNPSFGPFSLSMDTWWNFGHELKKKSFGPFSQVFGSVPGFLWLPKHLGCGIFELSTISP